MAALITYTAARSAVELVNATPTATTGDTFVNTGSEIAVVYNGSASPITATFTSTATVDGLAVADLAVTCAAGKRYVIGPFPKYVYGASVTLICSAVTSVTVAVCKVTPATV